jgi:hypothetical protein
MLNEALLLEEKSRNLCIDHYINVNDLIVTYSLEYGKGFQKADTCGGGQTTPPAK